MVWLPAAVYAVVALAFVGEAVTGFGGTVITVTLGAQFVPLDELLPHYVPINFVLSLAIVLRDHRHVARALLLRRMLPLIGLGMAAGLAIYRIAPPGPLLLVGYGALVAVLAALELRRGPAQTAGIGERARKRELAALLAGGAVHGIYGSGGPLIVWATSRQLHEKSALRATLAVLWLILGAVLMAQYASLGQLNAKTLAASATLLPVLGAALWLGHRIHDRIEPAAFRRTVYWLLLGGALSLLVRKGLLLLG